MPLRILTCAGGAHRGGGPLLFFQQQRSCFQRFSLLLFSPREGSMLSAADGRAPTKRIAPNTTRCMKQLRGADAPPPIHPARALLAPFQPHLGCEAAALQRALGHAQTDDLGLSHLHGRAHMGSCASVLRRTAVQERGARKRLATGCRCRAKTAAQRRHSSSMAQPGDSFRGHAHRGGCSAAQRSTVQRTSTSMRSPPVMRSNRK